MIQTLPVISNGTVRAPVGFNENLARHGLTLKSARVDTLQANVGKLCNQACKHCHVDAAPKRTEVMTRETVDACLRVLRDFKIATLDITGGAPELNPSFRYFVTEARKAKARVMARHNLTVMFETNQEDLPEFFKENNAEIVSSLPYFQEEQTDAQRGRGVFEKSIEALRRLNAVGYGVEESGLVLNLVYNPVGAFLPPPQTSIEADFKRELLNRYGITFSHLYTITNMPISRFLDYLRRSGNEERYMQKLVNAFNPSTVEGLMCRNLISVDWLGNLYDCDFNQMLELSVGPGLPQTIFDFDIDKFTARAIATGPHCFGCTAGAGSSCGGAVA
jgi:radical SAM/Cys-rich protein